MYMEEAEQIPPPPQQPQTLDLPPSTPQPDPEIITVQQKKAKKIAEKQVASPRPSSNKWYKQRFRDSWLLDDRFRSWLVGVPDDPFRARCKLCNADLRAGKSELEKHAKTKHHRDTVKAVEDVKALLGFANQAEAQNFPEIAIEMHSEEQSDVSLHVQENRKTVSRPASQLSFSPTKQPDSSGHIHPLGFGGYQKRGMHEQSHEGPFSNYIHNPSNKSADAKYSSGYEMLPTSSVPQVQKSAPDFHGIAVIDNQFKEIRLGDFRGKFLLLFFYPRDFTLVCPAEILEFSERIVEFRNLNVELIAVSTDSYYTHLAWTNTPRKYGGLGRVNIPLLSDFNKKISKDYNVLLEDSGIALRASFIIDPKGLVRHITVNDVNLYRSVDETLRLIKALQFVEKHGEVCSASWAPDSPERRMEDDRLLRKLDKQ